MWGTSSPDDKLADDLGNVIEGTSISGRRSDFFAAEKINAELFGTFATISAQGGPKHFRRHVCCRRKLTLGPLSTLAISSPLWLNRLLDDVGAERNRDA
jgi:hypothetical protein